MNKKLLAILTVGALVIGVFLAISACKPGGVSTMTPTGVGEILKVKVATDAAYPPFEYVDTTTSEIVGFDIDLMKAIAKAAGFEVEFINTPWDGIFVGLDNGNYDAVISAVSITDERKLTYDFSNPYYSIFQALIVRKADAGKYKSLADLKGKKVGAQIGTTGAIFVSKDPNLKLANYDDNGLAIEALLKGDVEAVVCDHPVAFDYALVNPSYGDKLVVTNNKITDTPEPYGICIKKGNTKIVDLINKGLKDMPADTIPQLEEKWKMK
jgi:polar amino acid transport system substrate-binding protein